MSDARDTCPLCSADLRDSSLSFAEGTRRIEIYDRDKDCTVAYRCPDCKGEWPRSIGEIIAAMEIN